MRALQLLAPGVLREVDVPEPESDGRAIIEVERVGICGTDRKIHSGAIPVAFPRIPGHEIVGRVVSAGRRNLVPAGARVLVDPAVACGTCAPCLADRPTICVRGALLGRDIDGGLAERIAVDELQLHPLPAGLDPQAEILLQVLGTCVHAFAQAPPARGTAVVIGLGVSGLIHVQLAALRGLDVIGVGRSPGKRAVALELGAIAACEPAEAESVVAAHTAGGGAALVVEAAGTVATLSQAVRLASPGATIVCFGTITAATEDDPFPWYQCYLKELRLVNPRAAQGRDYDEAVTLAERGAVRLAPLLTRTVHFEDGPVAFAADGRRGDLKTAIEVLRT